MDASEDPQKLGEHLEQDVDRLERGADELGREIDDVRQDWRRKRNDSSVPGAPPLPDDEPEAESEPEDQPG
jgi:hypothetical protein